MALWKLSLVEMAGALERGEASSEDLVAALEARADAVEGQVRAFTARYDARAAARQADAERRAGQIRGPLHGLPLSVKENLAMVGTPSTVGVRARLARPSSRHAAVVQAALDGGAVVLGKTNVPQLLLAIETHNDIWGTTHNPWSLRRAPGGSSGGEAAAIASGMSPAGIGTDIGGSIRNPAAWCGICGLKPTWGRWSTFGSAGGQPGQEAVKAVAGPMARTVADLLFLWRGLSPERQHAVDPVVPPLPIGDPAAVDLRGMRVGVYTDDGVFEPAASVRRGVERAAAALAARGAEIVPYRPPRAWDMVATYFGLMGADGMVTARGVIEGEPITPQLQTIARLARLPGFVKKGAAVALRARGEGRVAAILSVLGRKEVHEVWKLVVEREALKRAELDAWAEAGLHVLLGPPSVTPAALLGETHDWSLGAWHTMRYNLLDMPAGVVPVTRVRADEEARSTLVDRLDRKAATFEAGSGGLPVGVQVIGLPWEEHRVLAAMAAIEAEVRGDEGFPVTPVDPAA
jgi:fatty acid amide hydrolase